MDAYANLDKLGIPVHIYHGKDDNIVPLTASQKAMKRLKDAHLTTLEDTGHALTPEQQAQIGFEIADEIFNGMKQKMDTRNQGQCPGFFVENLIDSECVKEYNGE